MKRRLSPLILTWFALATTFLQITFHMLEIIQNMNMQTSSSFPGGPTKRQYARELRSIETVSSSSDWNIEKEIQRSADLISLPYLKARSQAAIGWRMPKQTSVLISSTATLRNPISATSTIAQVPNQASVLTSASSTTLRNPIPATSTITQALLSTEYHDSQPAAKKTLSPLLAQSQTHFYHDNNNFVVQPIDENAENNDYDASHSSSSLSSIYWNLSCPLEMSMFSGSHIGGDYLRRAREARDFVMMQRVVERVLQDDWPNLEQKLQKLQQRPLRIYLVGDSLMRQVFISWACLLWQHVESFAIPWFDETRVVRATLPNTIANGPHSKFEEGRVRFRNDTIEIIYHHGMGGVLVLGDDYHDHDDGNLWIESCYRRQPLSTNIIDIPDNVQGEHVVTESTVVRKRVAIQPSDVVLMNGSVHRQRQLSLNNMVDLMDCMHSPKFQKMLHEALPNQEQPVWPTFAYVMTGAEHFPTESGSYEARLRLLQDMDMKCLQTSINHDRQDQEWTMFSKRIPVLGQQSILLESTLGHFHVGGKDCLHWLQPGLPDLIAAEASHFVASLQNYTFVTSM